MAIVNVFHVQNGGQPPNTFSLTAITAVANGVGAAFRTNMMSVIRGDYIPGTAVATDLSSAVGLVASYSYGGTGGGGTGPSVPNSACAGISWKITRQYRGGRPRTYIGPLGTTGLKSPTDLSDSLVSALTTGAGAFLTSVNSIAGDNGSCKLVCVHRKLNQIDLLVPTVDQIIGSSIDSRIDTQRKRLGKDR